MWGNCDPEEKSDNEKQDSASGNRPTKVSFFTSLFTLLSIERNFGWISTFRKTSQKYFKSQMQIQYVSVYQAIVAFFSIL